MAKRCLHKRYHLLNISLDNRVSFSSEQDSSSFDIDCMMLCACYGITVCAAPVMYRKIAARCTTSSRSPIIQDFRRQHYLQICPDTRELLCQVERVHEVVHLVRLVRPILFVAALPLRIRRTAGGDVGCAVCKLEDLSSSFIGRC